MIAPGLGGFGIAAEQSHDFYAANGAKTAPSPKGSGSFYDFIAEVLGSEQGAHPYDGTAKEMAVPPPAQRYGGNFDSSQLLGADAPSDRSISCHLPSAPLDPSFLDRLMHVFTALFSEATAEEQCPDAAPVASQPVAVPAATAAATAAEAAAATAAATEAAAQAIQAVHAAPPILKTPYDDIIHRASATHEVGEDLIRAVISEESGFNPSARSREGAMGLMQLMPRTAKELGVSKPYNPEENIMGGSLYLSRLLDRYNGNLKMVLAAYNWGPGNLEQYPSQVPKVVQKYVANVMARMENYEVAANG